MSTIGNVKLNLKFYTGEDKYSDGDIENDILEIVKRHNDFTEILANDNRWPILYHLSPIRRNLLEWYQFGKESTILEIGAGCGALTGLLCEKSKGVVAVELSKRRAEIIGHRHKQHTNLEIIVGNLNDIAFEEKFDVITLVGVLEYATQFTGGSNPHHDFLLGISKLLKPDGKLIIAIENKFGLKYWAGAPEDHTNRLFDSLEGYPKENKVATFGKEELSSLFRLVDFSNLQYYYPMPDYKLPTQIFSDDFWPDTEKLDGFSPNYDSERIKLFDERLAYINLLKNKQFPFFANSFLVVCQKGR